MPNIRLNYRYRDYANYKNHGEVIFNNLDGYSLEQVDATIRTHLLDDQYFFASRWGLKDLHFEKYDDELDHSYHEYIGVELTKDVATKNATVTELLKKVIYGSYEW
jgi:hypothetical protein